MASLSFTFFGYESFIGITLANCYMPNYMQCTLQFVFFILKANEI